MASTYSQNLALELIGTGEQSGVWGTTTNNNFGTLLEQSISGNVTQAITDGADTTITIPSGTTGVARNMAIEMTGALTATRNLIVPANKKLYFIFNNTTGGFAVTVKVTGLTGVSVPNGAKIALVSNGTDVVSLLNYMASLTLGAALPVASGGTGVTTSTGTTNVVLSNSPTLVTPALGTPSALVGTNITGTATAFTASNVTTNANLTGDVTSVGNATTLTNAAVIAKVLTGYVSGAGTVAATDSILQAIQKLNGNNSTNANLTGPITSVGNATSVAAQTGTGSTFVMQASPSLTTPALGTPSSGTLTNCTFPTLNQNTTGTAAGLSATLAVSSGGTGASSTTAYAVYAGNSAGTGFSTIAPSTSGNILTSNGTNWASSAPAAVVSSLTGTANQITVSAATGAVTISIPSNGNGYGVRTVSSSSASGGSDGDIWYQI